MTGVIPNHSLPLSNYTSIRARLTTQMLLIVISMMVLVYIVFALSFFSHQYSQIRTQTENELLSDLETMEFFLNDVMDKMSILSQRDLITQALVDPAGREDYLPKLLKDRQVLFGLTGLALVNKSHELLYKDPKSNITPCISGNRLPNNKFFYRHTVRMVCVSVPIVLYDFIQGYLVGMVPINDLMKLVKQKEVGLTQLFVGDKLVIENQYLPGRLKSGKSKNDTKTNQRFSRQYEMYERYGSGDLRYLRELNIKLVRGVVFERIYGSTVDGLIDLLLLTCVIIVSTFFFARYVVRQLTQPILELCEKVSSNNETVLCSPTGSKDELETLAQVFDKKTKDLNAAKIKAMNSDRAKSVFLANMSHEIRTPMNAIIGLAEILKKTSLNDQQVHYTNNIGSAAERLLMLINDVLDLSKIESGKLALDNTQFSLHRWVDDLTIIFSNHDKEDVELIFSFDSQIPEQIVGDPLRLSQVCINLISNAIKFTDEGIVEFKLAIERKLDKPFILMCSVTDSGLGMSPEKIQEIFKPFVQAETNTSRKYGGTGLGLSISKQLVELMGGELTCSSKVNIGSRFDFTVILEEVESGEVHTYFTACENKKTLLIAHQESLYLNSIMSTLSRLGLLAEQINGIDKTLAIIQQVSDCDLIIYDCSSLEHRTVGDCNCIDCFSKITHNNSKPMIVILDRQTKERLRFDGDSDLYCFVEKPLNTYSLAQGINDFFTQKGQPETQSSQNEIKIAETDNLSGLRILLVEDNDINQEIAIYILEEYGAQITLAENGLEAVEETQQKQFDCVLMDLQMPVMNGIEATNIIRQDPRYHKIPIIALTADAMPEELNAIKASGMNARVLKPIDSLLLLKTIKTLVCSNVETVPENHEPRKDFID